MFLPREVRTQMGVLADEYERLHRKLTGHLSAVQERDDLIDRLHKKLMALEAGRQADPDQAELAALRGMVQEYRRQGAKVAEIIAGGLTDCRITPGDWDCRAVEAYFQAIAQTIGYSKGPAAVKTTRVGHVTTAASCWDCGQPYVRVDGADFDLLYCPKCRA